MNLRRSLKGSEATAVLCRGLAKAKGSEAIAEETNRGEVRGSQQSLSRGSSYTGTTNAEVGEEWTALRQQQRRCATMLWNTGGVSHVAATMQKRTRGQQGRREREVVWQVLYCTPVRGRWQ